MIRIYSEYVPFDRLAEPALLTRLADKGIQLAIAVQPHQLAALSAYLERVADLETRPSLAIWPMLEDHNGRWLNTMTFGRYLQFADTLLETLPNNPDAWIFDVEPPLHDLRRVMRFEGAFSNKLVRSMVHDWKPMQEAIGTLLRRVATRGMTTVAAAPAVCAIGIERALGTPISSLDFEQVDVMVYPSLLEGYLGLSRRNSQRALEFITRRARQRWGARARIALGITGPGALGDERPYETAAQLKEDAALTRRNHVHGISLHGLAGALPDLETWFDALQAHGSR